MRGRASTDVDTLSLADRSPPRQPRWTVTITGQGVFRQAVLPKSGSIVIGRDVGCDLIVEHPTVSRRHAVLEIGPPLVIRDLGSTNGTQVAGVRLVEGAPATFGAGVAVQVGSVLLVIGALEELPHAADLPPKGGVLQVEDHAVVVQGVVERLVALVDQVAAADISVLILGETGVGKDAFAELVHHRSPRRGGPYVRLHCAAMSSSLIESELFGHEVGAFTGATRARAGLLEAADGGTVFIDEVGELPLSVQVKLLRVLEDRRVTRVGAVTPRRVDVRFVAATNRDLRERIARGEFRSDLYYRLSGVTIEIPPLRERREEIEYLARWFLLTAAERSKVPAPPFTLPALTALREYAWPGNIRELRNVVERALLFARGGFVDVAHLQLPDPEPPPSAPPTPRASLDDLRSPQEAAIRRALEQCAGNQTAAAKVLGISRRTLVNRIESLGITRPRKG